MTRTTLGRTLYVQQGMLMTRKRQALVMLYHDKHRRLGYATKGPNGTVLMPWAQWLRYQEWINAFLKPSL